MFTPAAPTAPNVQQLVNFTRDTITVVLEWTPLDKVSYSITLVPDATTQGVVNGTIQLSLAYNRLYNFSIVATLCGRASAPTIIRLKYGKLLIYISIVIFFGGSEHTIDKCIVIESW